MNLLSIFAFIFEAKTDECLAALFGVLARFSVNVTMMKQAKSRPVRIRKHRHEYSKQVIN